MHQVNQTTIDARRGVAFRSERSSASACRLETGISHVETRLGEVWKVLRILIRLSSRVVQIVDARQRCDPHDVLGRVEVLSLHVVCEYRLR